MSYLISNDRTSINSLTRACVVSYLTSNDRTSINSLTRACVVSYLMSNNKDISKKQGTDFVKF